MAKTLKQQGFNPLNRVKFVQIKGNEIKVPHFYCFNPLNRVKFVQIDYSKHKYTKQLEKFQSPKSGQICSNRGLAKKPR